MRHRPGSPQSDIAGRELTVQSGPMGGQGSGSHLDWDNARVETLSAAFQYAISFLRRQWLLILLGTLVGIGLFVSAFFLMPGRYEAIATIMFDPNKVTLFTNSMVGDATLDSSTGLESQVQIISTEAVAKKAMQRLNLQDDPAFAPPTKSRVERWFGPTVAEYMGRSGRRSEDWNARYRLDSFMGEVGVRRLHGTYAVNISYQSDSPARAAMFANAVAYSFLDKQIEDRSNVNRRAADWLKKRLDELRAQTATAQAAINAFRTSNSLFDSGGQAVSERQMGELNAQLMAERSKIGDTEARLQLVESAIRDYAHSSVKPSVPDLMNNPLVTKLREQYFELSNKRVEFLGRFGASHQSVKKLDQRMAEIHVAMLDEYQRLAESYRSDIQISRRREATVDKALQVAIKEMRAGQSAHIRLRELESSAQTYQSLYDGFLKRYSESNEQEAFPFARAQMATEATEPLGRNYKKTIRFGSILFALSVALGCMGAVLRELTDRTFRRLDEVERTLERPLVAVIPNWRGAGARRRFGVVRASPPPADTGEMNRQQSVVWAPELAPQSQFSEAFRAIKLQLDRQCPGPECKVLGVASVRPGEGSSMVSAALAVATSMCNARVLLLDWDLRHPVLTEQFAPNGLVEVLYGEATLDEAIKTDARTQLSFLPVGSLRGARPDELLASEAMDRLMALARTKFDYIIIDLPPIVPMVDVALISRLVDTFLGVVEWGRSEKERTRLAFERVPQFNERLMGVAMNKVDMKRFHLYDPNGASWFDERSYSNYLNMRAASVKIPMKAVA
jgi:polysaccharide biosynthesis transport protein